VTIAGGKKKVSVAAKWDKKFTGIRRNIARSSIKGLLIKGLFTKGSLTKAKARCENVIDISE
jgi:hypothetical protein